MPYLIEKQLSLKWQVQLTKTLPINPPDCYQYHCITIRKNTMSAAHPRTYVITQLFLYSIICSYNKNTTQIEFGQTKWLVPIQAIKRLSIITPKGKQIKINLLIIFGIIVAVRLPRLVSQLSILQKSTLMIFPGVEVKIMERLLLDVIQMKVRCRFSI